jgi:hypothetical protein
MRVADIDAHSVWVGPLIFFTLALVAVVHTSSSTLKPEEEYNLTHPLHTSGDIPTFLLHTLAYYIACFAVTCLLILCTLIILLLAMLCIEVIIGAFHFARSYHTQRFQRLETTLSQEAQDLQRLDTYCDSWNYR